MPQHCRTERSHGLAEAERHSNGLCLHLTLVRRCNGDTFNFHPRVKRQAA